MASIEVKDGSLVVHIQGMDRLFTMRSTLSVPLAHVTGVVARPEVPELKFMESGSNFRGVQRYGTLCAGTVTMPDGAGYVFCDVHDAKRAVAIELEHDAYKRLIVEVSDETPEITRDRIEAEIRKVR